MTTVSVYCERLAPGLLGEPFNTVTNLAFLLAAWLGWRRAGQHRDQRLLAALLGAIGVGSTLFHAGLTVWTEWADLAGVYAIALMLGCMTLHRVRGLLVRQHTASWPFIVLYVVLWSAACASIFTIKSWYLVLGAIAVIAGGGLLILRHTAPDKSWRWFAGSMGFAVLAVAFFAMDIQRIGCDPQAWIQPHGNWHICAALSFLLYYRFVRSSTATHAAL